MDPVLKSKVVSVNPFKSDRSSTILASFQNGEFLRVDQNSAKRVVKSDTQQEFALVATAESVYKADITAASPFVDSYIAIHDKKTKKIKLVQVHSASFKHTIYDSKQSIFENNIVDAKKVLYKDFGGKKSLATYERNKKTAPNVEILEETLDKQLDNIEENAFEQDFFDKSLQERQKLQSSIFPDIDLSSGRGVRDVFTAKKLLGEDILEHLKEVAIQVLKAKPDKLPFTTKYLNDCVHALQITKQPDSSENLERIAMFIYIDGLVHLLNSRKRSLDGIELSKMSNFVERDIRKKFSYQENMTNSKFTRQKGIIYYLIMLLISTDTLQIELDEALEGVDLTRTELIKYATVFGAKVKNKTTLYIQRAKLDKDSQLSAPAMTGRKRRRD